MTGAGKILSAKIARTTMADTEPAWPDAKRGLLDYLAAAGAGAKTAQAAKLLELLREEGGAPQAAYLFTGGLQGSRGQTALYHGLIGHLLDYDDVHEEVRGHPSTVLLPALLALRDESQEPARFLSAYVIGVDVMARLGRCIPGHYVAGWHSTATFGAIAAAAAGAWYCGYGAEETERAMGIAATRAAGLRAQFGSDMKAFHAGYAARTGMEAIQLLRWGFSARAGVLDEFLNLYGGGEADSSELTRDWGTPWRISKPGLWMKRYPFCSAAAHVRDAAAELVQQVDPEKIAKIEIVYPPHGDAALLHQDPQNGEEGRFSPEYVAALVLRGIPLTFDRFSKNCPVDEATRLLMKKAVRVHDEGIMPSPEAMPRGRFTILRVWDLNGELVSARVDAPTGSPAKPLTEEELFGKLKESVGKERAEKIWMKVQSL